MPRPDGRPDTSPRRNPRAHPDCDDGYFWQGLLYAFMLEAVAVALALALAYWKGWIPL